MSGITSIPCNLILGIFFCSVCLSYAQDARECEMNTCSMCVGLEYTGNFTQFPNVFGQANQEEACTEVQRFAPLIDFGCSDTLRKFLCFLYVPPCTIYRLVLPCRRLCEEVRSECAPLMGLFDFEWPAELDCEQYPVNTDPTPGQDEMCYMYPTVRPTAGTTLAPTETRMFNNHLCYLFKTFKSCI